MAQRRPDRALDPDHAGDDVHLLRVLGVDLQQISIAALIIALGLLVDDPVVAGDAINRELADGTPRDVAAWLGPQKLSRAILYATITNCAAFLPLLACSGLVGEYIWSLPVVVTSSLVASRLVSMTFIPLLGYYLLKGQPGMEAGLKEGGRSSRFARIYNGFSEVCMEHKWASLAVCLIGLGAGVSLLPLIGTNLFPKDLHSAFTVNLFLPEGSPIRESKAEAMAAVAAIDEIAGADVEAYTTFVGAGGPRFWLSIVPEQPASNYAQVLVHTRDKYQTYRISERVKNALPPRLTVARAHVQALESGPPIGVPVQFRVLGRDPATVRRLGDQIKGFMREFPGTDNIEDDWDPESVQIGLRVDPDRANVSGVSHQDVALFVGGALSGFDATTIRQRDRLIPVTLKLRPDERSRMDDLRTMSVVSSQTGARVPLDQIGSFRTEFIPPKIGRRDNERCMIIKCDIAPGMLTSVVYRPCRGQAGDGDQGLAGGLPLPVRRREGGARQGIRLPGDRDGGVHPVDLPGLDPPVQQPGQAAGGLRGGALRDDRRPDGADRLRRAPRVLRAAGRLVAGRGDHQSRDRPLRVHRGGPRARRAAPSRGDRRGAW